MNGVLSVVAVGFEFNEVPRVPHIMFAVYNPARFAGLSDLEIYQRGQKYVVQADVLVCNLGKENLTPDETVLIHTAHTKSTPLLAVGHKVLTPMINAMVANRFVALDNVVDHLRENYQMGK